MPSSPNHGHHRPAALLVLLLVLAALINQDNSNAAILAEAGAKVNRLPLVLGGSGPNPATPPLPAPTVPTGTRWSDPASWPNRTLPAAGAFVQIPAGLTMLLDTTPPPLRALQIDGTLTFAERDVELTVGWIMVHAPGRLQIGSETRPFRNRATITLSGYAPDENVMGMGSKFIGAMGGTLDIHGAPTATSWTKLNAEAAAGATTITLAEAPGWAVGDQIVIASSGYDQGAYDQAEIAAINGAQITLRQPLRYAHFGIRRQVGTTPIDVRAEVGRLTRNIVIQGDADSLVRRFGGHMMFMAAGPTTVRLSNVELRRMGQFDRLGRYPVHFHLIGTACQNCSVRDLSIRDTIQRGIVVHDTAGVQVTGNVVFNTVGHNIVVETTNTPGNTFQRNLTLVNQQPSPAFTAAGLADQSDDIPSGFWVRNAQNTFTDNAVAGSRGMGFFLDNTLGGPLIFQRNVAHSAMTYGAQRDFNMQSGVLIVCNDGAEQPQSAKITDLLVYRNGGDGRNNPSGFWPEQCTTFKDGYRPFEIARIQAIDNTGNNIQLRGVEEVYTIEDAIMTGSLLGPPLGAEATAIHLQYGGMADLVRPVFAHYTRTGIALDTGDVTGAFLGYFRIRDARLLNVTVPNFRDIGDTMVVEALDDSFLPRGGYVAPEFPLTTLWTADCARVTNFGDGSDHGVYHCPQVPPMTFLVMRQGDTEQANDRIGGGTPLHTLHPLTRSDGASFPVITSGFGGYEVTYGSTMRYSLPAQPQGRLTIALQPMYQIALGGADQAASLELAVPYAAAPSAVYRDALDRSEGVLDGSRLPTAAMRISAAPSLAAFRADPVNSYFYDSAAKTLYLSAMTRWLVVDV